MKYLYSPQYCRPGGPATANHLIQSPLFSTTCPADSGLLVQGTDVPEERGRYLLKCRSFGRRARKGKQRKSQPHQPAPGTNEPGAPAPSQTSDSHQQAQPSASGKIGSDSLDRGPTSLQGGSWNVMSAATQKPKTKLLTRSVHTSDSRIEASAPVDSSPLSSYENLVMRWSQPTQENKDTFPPAFVPVSSISPGFSVMLGRDSKRRSIGGRPQTKHRNTVREEE